MRPDQLAALRRKNKGSCGAFYISGLQNLADLVSDSTRDDDVPPTPRPVPSKSEFGSLMGQAKKGGEDYVSLEKRKVEEQKKEEYRRSHAQPTTTPTNLLHGLPSLQTLQHLTNAIQAGTAFQGDFYRPNYASPPQKSRRKQDEYRPSSPYLDPGSTRITDARHITFSSKGANPYKNCCQVSICDHEYFCIEWDSSDPDNGNNSWKARLKYYWDYASAQEDHKSCQQPDRLARCTVIAERIIQKFVDMEDGKLSRRDIHNGLQASRPPPLNRVEREVRTMFSHIFRSETEKIFEKKEALRVHLDVAQRRKEFVEKTQQRAQKEREYKVLAKGPDIDDLEDVVTPIIKMKQPKKIAQTPRRNPGKQKEKVLTPLVDRFRYTTSKDSQAQIAEPSRNDRPIPISTIPKNLKKTLVQPKLLPKPRVRLMTIKERFMLASIRKAAGDTDIYVQPETSNQHKSPGKCTPSFDPFKANRGRKADQCQVSLSPDVSKKRKVSAVEDSMLNKQPVTKKGRTEHKSAATIEDSDAEANYKLPKVSSKLPEEAVREGWQVEGTALVEEAVHQQEELQEKRETAIELGEEVVVYEAIETAKTPERQMEVEDKPGMSSLHDESPITNVASPSLRSKEPFSGKDTGDTSSLPSSAPSPSRKRKNRFSETADDETDSTTSSSSKRPIKKLKTGSSCAEVSSRDAHPRPTSTPYFIDTEGDRSLFGKAITVTADEEKSEMTARSQTGEKEDYDDGLDELFEDDKDYEL